MTTRTQRTCTFLLLLTTASCSKIFSGGPTGSGSNVAPTPVWDMATCSVSRVECTGFVDEVIDDEGDTEVICPAANVIANNFTATQCYDGTQFTAQQACNDYCVAPLYPLAGEAGATCTAIVSGAVPASPGECSVTPGTDNGRTSLVTCTRTGRVCEDLLVTNTSGEQFVCGSLPLDNVETASTCFDPTVNTASGVCTNGYMSPKFGALTYPVIDVMAVQANAPSCAPTPPAFVVAYGVDAGSIATAQLPTSQVPIASTAGFLTLAESGSGDVHLITGIQTMQIAVADITVQGITITGASLQLLAPVAFTNSSGQLKVAAGAMSLQLNAMATGIPLTQLVISPNSDLPVTISGTTFTMSGQFSTIGPSTGNTVIPATINVNIHASTTSSNASCAGLTPTQQLLGFESLQFWKSNQVTLSLDANNRTQGCFGMDVSGSGYRTLSSTPFQTPLPGTTSKLGLDVFIPTGQPNPFWLGAVQMYLSCPAENFNNQYIGQDELTGLPVGKFSTLSYALPSGILSELNGSHSDCFFTIAVNMNQAATPPVLDNLRFQ